MRIAQSQRDIALDKLKFDLFKVRHEIYQAAKELIEYMALITEKSGTTICPLKCDMRREPEHESVEFA